MKSKQLIFFFVGIIGFIMILLLLTTGSVLGLVATTSWYTWVLTIFFAVFMWLYFQVVFKFKYSFTFILSIFLAMAVIFVTVGLSTHSLKIGSPNKMTVKPSSEWIWYTGSQSDLLTFQYPKGYYLRDNNGYGSIQLYATEKDNAIGGDHLTISWYAHDEKNPYDMVADCEGFGKRMGDRSDDSIGKDYKFRYAKVTQLGTIKACDYGISLIQADDLAAGRMYEFTIDFIVNNRSFGIIGYAQKEKDLDVFYEIANTFKMK